MRPIPWILLGLAATALGIASTREGRRSVVPRPLLVSRWERTRVPDALPGPDGVPVPGAVGPGAPAALTAVAVPKKSTPPVAPLADVLVPRSSLRLLVVSGPNVKLAMAPPPLTAADAPQVAFASFTMETLEKELRGLLEEAAAPGGAGKAEICLVCDADARWDESVRPVLEICAKAGLSGILLGAVRSEDATGLAALPYPFFEETGSVVATLSARSAERDDGGVLEVKAGGYDTFFGYRGKNQKRVDAFEEDIRSLHTEISGFEGARYSDSGRKWTIRPAARSSYEGLVQAASLLRKIGIQRFGIEVE